MDNIKKLPQPNTVNSVRMMRWEKTKLCCCCLFISFHTENIDSKWRERVVSESEVGIRTITIIIVIINICPTLTPPNQTQMQLVISIFYISLSIYICIYRRPASMNTFLLVSGFPHFQQYGLHSFEGLVSIYVWRIIIYIYNSWISIILFSLF